MFIRYYDAFGITIYIYALLCVPLKSMNLDFAIATQNDLHVPHISLCSYNLCDTGHGHRSYETLGRLQSSGPAQWHRLHCQQP